MYGEKMEDQQSKKQPRSEVEATTGRQLDCFRLCFSAFSLWIHTHTHIYIYIYSLSLSLSLSLLHALVVSFVVVAAGGVYIHTAQGS